MDLLVQYCDFFSTKETNFDPNRKIIGNYICPKQRQKLKLPNN